MYSSVVTEGNKHANSCALVCEKYLASKCRRYFLGSLKRNSLRAFGAADRQRGPWVNITKREEYSLVLSLSLVLPRVLVAAGGLVAAGSRAVMEGGSAGWSTIPTGSVVCQYQGWWEHILCLFSW